MDKKTIWIIVGLVGGYIFCQVLADIAATKLIIVAGTAIPSGTFIFAATFTLRDLLHKRLGKNWAKAVIWTAAGLNVIMALYVQGMAAIPAPEYYPYDEAWSSIFAFVPAIVVASIVAELIAELLDTEIYHWWWKNKGNWPQWTRVFASNMISLPVDSLIFAGLGFVFLPPLFGGEPLPLEALPAIISGQIVVKGLITILSMPTIYLVKEQPLLATEEVGLD